MTSPTWPSVFLILPNDDIIDFAGQQWHMHEQSVQEFNAIKRPSNLQEHHCFVNRISSSCYWDFVSAFGISKQCWDTDRQRREGGAKLAYSSINTMPLFYFIPCVVVSMPVQRAQSVKNDHCGTLHTGRQYCTHRANFQQLPMRPDGQSLGLWTKDLCHVFS